MFDTLLVNGIDTVVTVAHAPIPVQEQYMIELNFPVAVTLMAIGIAVGMLVMLWLSNRK